MTPGDEVNPAGYSAAVGREVRVFHYKLNLFEIRRGSMCCVIKAVGSELELCERGGPRGPSRATGSEYNE